MVVSLLRVIYTGLQDERLLPPKGRPAFSFFQKVFVKAGRFTTAWVRLDFDTRPNFGSMASITLPRQGHLISRVYLVTTMPDIVGPQLSARARVTEGTNFVGPTFGWTNSLGHALVTDATIDIGGARIEQITGQLMEVLDEFQTSLEKTTIMNTLLPRIQNGFKPTSIGWEERPAVAVTPLPFWFSRGDPGVVLPIDAINNDQVRLNISFAPLNALYVSSAQVPVTNASEGAPGSAYYSLTNSVFFQSVPPQTIPMSASIPILPPAVACGGNAPSSGIYQVAGLNGNPEESQVVEIISGVQMAPSYVLGDTYVIAEYVYLDKPEANKFRISDIQYPIPQHYIFEPYDTNGLPRVNIPLRIPNPTRDLFFFAQRIEATAFNAPFLATRDLSGLDVRIAPWWPDCSGLNPVNLEYLVPGFSTRESEPLLSISLVYEGKLLRYSTVSPSVFRSLLPAYEQKKAPWLNRYYYNLSFGVQHGLSPPSVPYGEANLDKIERIELRLQMKPLRGSMDPNCVPRYRIFCYAETYNMFRIYGGRAGLLFQF